MSGAANHGYGWVDGARVPIVAPVSGLDLEPGDEAAPAEPGGWWPSEASPAVWLEELDRAAAATVSASARQDLVYWLAGCGLHPVVWARRWGSALRTWAPDLWQGLPGSDVGGWLGHDRAVLRAMFPHESYTVARRRLDAVWYGLGDKLARGRSTMAISMPVDLLGCDEQAAEWAGVADGMADDQRDLAAEAGAVARLAMGSLLRWIGEDGSTGLPPLKRFYALVYYRYRDLVPGMSGDDFARIYGQGRAAWSADAKRIMGRPLEERLGYRPVVPGQKSAESRAAYAENARRHLPRRQLGGQAGLERAVSADAEARLREAEDRARIAKARREAEARELARDAEAMREMAAATRARRGK